MPIIQSKKQGTVELLLEVYNKRPAMNLLIQGHIADNELKVIPHRRLNHTHGVIFDTDFANETEADLLEGLLNQRVTPVMRKPYREIIRKSRQNTSS